MRTVNIREAKAHLSKLVDAAMGGEEIIITKAGNAVARLGPLVSTVKKRRFGVLKGKVKISNDFDVPLSSDTLTDFEGFD